MPDGRQEHQDHYIANANHPDGVILHMRPRSFLAESAAYILVANSFKHWPYEPEDADEWHRRATGIVFW